MTGAAKSGRRSRRSTGPCDVFSVNAFSVMPFCVQVRTKGCFYFYFIVNMSVQQTLSQSELNSLSNRELFYSALVVNRNFF